MSDLILRKWQAEFAEKLANHPRPDFLLVACPAAGKTIGAAAGVAAVLEAERCDQLIVICPTVVVRDQWQSELGGLGFNMVHQMRSTGWPDYVHGICATYAQVSVRPDVFAAACAKRRTVVIFDEVHHAGERRTWGDTVSVAFGSAVKRLHLSGTPFRSDGAAIPFVPYAKDGKCKPDFAYDYPQAVRDGVCRPVEFKAHDGEITWLEEDKPITARFTDVVEKGSRAKRLRASLDPSKSYLLSMLEDAHADLTKMRERVPDAAGLIVCDTQAHALEVDRVLNELTGTVPILAISDLPRAHAAIESFSNDDDEWLVSVRMVAEGVDIPRLGVIVWATAASTELMVRQVAGRALRGRGAHVLESAIVHMPADPQLCEYAARLDVLTGVSTSKSSESAGRRQQRGVIASQSKCIDPTPFVEWFDRLVPAVGVGQMCVRCGWTYEAGTRLMYRWREEGGQPNVLTVYDACHMAGVDFDELFSDEKYADARAYVNDPALMASRAQEFTTIEAEHRGVEGISPDLPALEALPVASVPDPITVVTPELPPSPEQLREEEEARTAARADLYQLLNTYVALRREVDPGFGIGRANGELARELGGPVTAESSDDVVAEAQDLVNQWAAAIAVENPEAVKALARARRRAAVTQAAA